MVSIGSSRLVCLLFIQIALASATTTVENSKCEANVVVVICKPLIDNNSSPNPTILPTVLGERHEHTIKLETKLNRQIQQTLVLLKSIVITTKFSQPKPLFLYPKPCVNFIIVGKDAGVLEELENEIQKENWDKELSSILRLHFVQAKYPLGMEWMENIYRQCATLRLFLPELLTDYKQVIYVDTDIIFLRSPAQLQEGFKYFTSQQLAAITPELEIRTNTTMEGLYNPQSYNTGVMLMDLDKMRRKGWSSKVGIVAELVLKESFYGDQDVLIVYFKFNRDELMDLPCHWNFMPKYCRINCGHVQGISVIHGLVASFFLPQGSPYEVLFRFLQQYPITQESQFAIPEFNKKLGDRMWSRKVKSQPNSSNYCARLIPAINQKTMTFTEAIMKTMHALENGNIPNSNSANLFPPKSSKEVGVRPKLFVKTSILSFSEFSQNRKTFQAKNIVIAVTFVEYIYNYYSQLPLFTAMLKSLLLSRDKNSKITLVAITDNSTHCQRMFLAIESLNPKDFYFECAVGEYTKEFRWMKDVFKPGVFLRLMYPELIPYDAVIHIDTDIIFRNSISHLWSKFDEFLPSQIIGATRQLSIAGTTSDIFPDTAYQAGIMLMNLRQMRDIRWTSQLQMMAEILKPKFQQEKKLLPVQTLLHIYFKFHQNQIYELDTAWNFLPHYCNPELELESKIYAIHGVNNSFTRTDTMEPLFRQIYLETLESIGNELRKLAKVPGFSCNSLCAQSKHFQKEWFLGI